MTRGELEEIISVREQKAKKLRALFFDYLENTFVFRFPLNIKKIYENLGIKISFKKGLGVNSTRYMEKFINSGENILFLRPEDTALTTWNNDVPSVEINTNLSSEYKRFVFSHELAHIIFPNIVYFQDYFVDKENFYKKESLINSIAMNIIFPQFYFHYYLENELFYKSFSYFDVPLTWLFMNAFDFLKGWIFTEFFFVLDLNLALFHCCRIPNPVLTGTFYNPDYKNETIFNINKGMLHETIYDSNSNFTHSQKKGRKELVTIFNNLNILKKIESGPQYKYKHKKAVFSLYYFLMPCERVIQFNKGQTFLPRDTFIINTQFLIIIYKFENYPMIFKSFNPDIYSIYVFEDEMGSLFKKWEKNINRFNLFMSKNQEEYPSETLGNDKIILGHKNHWIAELKNYELMYLDMFSQ